LTNIEIYYILVFNMTTIKHNYNLITTFQNGGNKTAQQNTTSNKVQTTVATM